MSVLINRQFASTVGLNPGAPQQLPAHRPSGQAGAGTGTFVFDPVDRSIGWHRDGGGHAGACAAGCGGDTFAALLRAMLPQGGQRRQGPEDMLRAMARHPQCPQGVARAIDNALGPRRPEDILRAMAADPRCPQGLARAIDSALNPRRPENLLRAIANDPQCPQGLAHDIRRALGGRCGGGSMPRPDDILRAMAHGIGQAPGGCGGGPASGAEDILRAIAGHPQCPQGLAGAINNALGACGSDPLSRLSRDPELRPLLGRKGCAWGGTPPPPTDLAGALDGLSHHPACPQGMVQPLRQMRDLVHSQPQLFPGKHEIRISPDGIKLTPVGTKVL